MEFHDDFDFSYSLYVRIIYVLRKRVQNGAEIHSAYCGKRRSVTCVAPKEHKINSLRPLKSKLRICTQHSFRTTWGASRMLIVSWIYDRQRRSAYRWYPWNHSGSCCMMFFFQIFFKDRLVAGRASRVVVVVVAVGCGCQQIQQYIINITPIIS